VTRDALTALDRELACQTSARFDLLAETHVGLAALGAADVEAHLERAIAKAEGVIAVTGRIGSGKSSLIAAVTPSPDSSGCSTRSGGSAAAPC
jgi:polynucleotide 5'-kinase involved in rRNA processing